MKAFVLTCIIMPATDAFVNDGKLVGIGVGLIARCGHAIADIGAAVMPSF